MLFNSPEFLFCYLPIVLLGYAVLGKFGRTPVVSWLAFSSLAFYAYWRPEFVLLLVGSIAVNYACSRVIWHLRERSRPQVIVLTLAITANLATLAFFRNLPAEAWMRTGIASGHSFTVRALAYILAGHVAHHRAILEERYL